MVYMDLEEEFTWQEKYAFYRICDGIPFYCNEIISVEEATEYVKRGRELYGNKLALVKTILKGDDIDILYELSPKPFERIRRITGYLVGTLDRFNDAKRSEESDRVKHEV